MSGFSNEALGAVERATALCDAALIRYRDGGVTAPNSLVDDLTSAALVISRGHDSARMLSVVILAAWYAGFDYTGRPDGDLADQVNAALGDAE